jgi:pyruvate, water dikinase
MSKRFTSPYEVPPVPGAEGWEDLYSYYLLFRREDATRVQQEESRFWFRDNVHLPEVLYPLDANLACDMNFSGIGAIANRALVVPNFRAYDPRIVNGYVYISSVEPTDPEEMGRRAQVFEPRIDHMLKNWDDFYGGWTRECDALIARMQALEFADLLEVEPDSVLPDLARHYPVHRLWAEYLELWDLMVRMSQQTKKALLPSYGGDLVFIDNMRKLFPGISDTAITTIAQGFESKLFRAVEELQRLAAAAFEAGLAEAFAAAGSWAELEGLLGGTVAGRSWLERFEAVRYPWFEMSTGEGWQRGCIAWNDDLDIPLRHLKDYLSHLAAGRRIARPREEVLAARDATAAKYRALIPNETDRQGFDQLVGLARMLAPASEDHSIYQGSWFRNLYARKLRRLGSILVNHGILAEAEDVFLFRKQDLDSVVWELYTSWCRGVEPAAKVVWPARLRRRKEILEVLRGWTAPPALGTVPASIESPTTIVLFGITPELVASWWEAGQEDAEVTAALQGFSGASGTAEGTARLCRSPEDIAELEPGEILVTPSTAPTWAPAFGMVSGVVTDMGGIFCHTAIVAREYGLPAVVGTGYATARIRTGDRIRIDGDAGTVEILERA